MSKLVIRVVLKSVYGKNKLYPVNEEALALAEIAGTMTLEPRVLRIAKHRLGADVQTVETDAATVAAMLT